MMNAIIVPTYPRDFHWTQKLIDSAGPNENLVLVFSSEEEQSIFDKLHPHRHRSVIAGPKPDFLESIVTHKKLQGLKQTYMDYDYVATIDTETLFLRETTPHLKQIWDDNCLVGNESTMGKDLIDLCLKNCSITNYPVDPKIYFWFNDIQVYDCKLIPEFLAWLPEEIQRDSFEYLLFGIFLITQKNHPIRMIDGVAGHGIVEAMSGTPQYRYLLNQVNWSTWFHGVEKYEKVKMIFHLDRYKK